MIESLEQQIKRELEDAIKTIQKYSEPDDTPPKVKEIVTVACRYIGISLSSIEIHEQEKDAIVKEIMVDIDKPTEFPEMTPKQVIDEMEGSIIWRLSCLKEELRRNKLSIKQELWARHAEKHGTDDEQWDKEAWEFARFITYQISYKGATHYALKDEESRLTTLLTLITQNKKRWGKD